MVALSGGHRRGRGHRRRHRRGHQRGHRRGHQRGQLGHFLDVPRKSKKNADLPLSALSVRVGIRVGVRVGLHFSIFSFVKC